MGDAPDVLKSQYNRARAGIGNSEPEPGQREQAICTPQKILNVPIAVWGGIDLDPCWAPGSIVPAAKHYYVPPRLVPMMDGAVQKKDKDGNLRFKTIYIAQEGDTDGLKEPWQDFTFVNPIYVRLKEWLAKAQREHDKDGWEIMLLCPSRGHRKWWRKAKRSAVVADLDPFCFVGYKSAIPLPMSLFYWGALKGEFCEAVKAVGEVL